MNINRPALELNKRAYPRNKWYVNPSVRFDQFDEHLSSNVSKKICNKNRVKSCKLATLEINTTV